jgi:hypothetical protein
MKIKKSKSRDEVLRAAEAALEVAQRMPKGIERVAHSKKLDS